jgi:hypothetical protein
MQRLRDAAALQQLPLLIGGEPDQEMTPGEV